MPGEAVDPPLNDLPFDDLVLIAAHHEVCLLKTGHRLVEGRAGYDYALLFQAFPDFMAGSLTSPNGVEDGGLKRGERW